jgi:hypothetical protein
VTQNAVEAKKWYRLAAESYRKAAEQNDAEAQYELGDCYNYGLVGMAKDKVEAVKWYRKAAEQDNAEAQYELGTCYQLGQGVKKDAAEAAKWYRKAVKRIETAVVCPRITQKP